MKILCRVEMAEYEVQYFLGKLGLCLVTVSKSLFSSKKKNHYFLYKLNKQFNFQNTKYKILFKKQNTTHFLENYPHLNYIYIYICV